MILDVIAASERRRQADWQSGINEDPMSYDDNLRAEDAALAALEAHLKGTSHE